MNSSNVADLIPGWSDQGGWFYANQPAIANGIAYVATANGGLAPDTLSAFNAISGAPLWQFVAPENLGSPPAVYGGKVYVTSAFRVYALEANTGAPVWTIPAYGASLPTVADGILYLSWGGATYALDAGTGATIWRHSFATMPGTFASVPAVANSIVYVTVNVPLNGYHGAVSHVYALKSATGGVLWEQLVSPDEGAGDPVIANNMVYVAAGDNNTYALDAYSGALLWKFATGFYLPSVAAANGIVYIASDYLYAVKASDGTLLWEFADSPYGIPVQIANGVIYAPPVGSSPGVAALDAATGTYLWQYTLSCGVEGQVVVNGTLYVVVAGMTSIEGEERAPASNGCASLLTFNLPSQ